jgi:hypothetical protein
MFNDRPTVSGGSRVNRGPQHNRQQRTLMKSYIITTGAAFGLLTAAHVARMFEEGAHLLSEPVFLSTTVAAASLCAWAAILVRKQTRVSRSTK